MKKQIILLASIALLAGCNKENSILSPMGGLKSSVAESSITADDKDPTNYMKLTDYLPSSQKLIYEERIEFLKYAYNESPTYRDRNLNEVMFLYEAGINMDMNHLAIPLNKFKIEQTFVDINIENGKIPAASIKEGFVAIKEHIKAQGLKKRYVGMLDIEPIRIVGNKVRLRAGLYTGVPIEENKLKVGENYNRPYGDMTFIEFPSLYGDPVCENIEPEDNAAFDLSGRFYNNGSYDIYASNNINYSFNGTQWVFNTDFTLNLYGQPISATFDPLPKLQQMYTYVNVHKDNWPLIPSYKDFYGNLIPGLMPGQIEVIHKDLTIPHNLDPTQMTDNSHIKPNLDILHGYTTKFKEDMNFWPSCSHRHYTEQGPTGGILANKIFYRDRAFWDRGGKSGHENCMSGCEFNDYVDWYTLTIRALSIHQGPYLIPIMSSNKSMVGAEVHACYFIMNRDFKSDGVTKQSNFGLAHFLFPTYGDKVNFMKD
jgi:hypothetical protein